MPHQLVDGWRHHLGNAHTRCSDPSCRGLPSMSWASRKLASSSLRPNQSGNVLFGLFKMADQELVTAQAAQRCRRGRPVP